MESPIDFLSKIEFVNHSQSSKCKLPKQFCYNAHYYVFFEQISTGRECSTKCMLAIFFIHFFWCGIPKEQQELCA